MTSTVTQSYRPESRVFRDRGVSTGLEKSWGFRRRKADASVLRSHSRKEEEVTRERKGGTGPLAAWRNGSLC